MQARAFPRLVLLGVHAQGAVIGVHRREGAPAQVDGHPGAVGADDDVVGDPDHPLQHAQQFVFVVDAVPGTDQHPGQCDRRHPGVGGRGDSEAGGYRAVVLGSSRRGERVLRTGITTIVQNYQCITLPASICDWRLSAHRSGQPRVVALVRHLVRLNRQVPRRSKP